MTVRKSDCGDPLPDHIARWLEAVTKRLHLELGAQSWDFPGLRGSHRRILQMIPPDGIRITDLARLAGMTKQALGEFVNSLEDSGFVSSGPHPADRRVRLVRRTRQGDEAAESATRAIASVESSWRQEIGSGRYDAMKQALRELGAESFKT